MNIWEIKSAVKDLALGEGQRTQGSYNALTDHLYDIGCPVDQWRVIRPCASHALVPFFDTPGAFSKDDINRALEVNADQYLQLDDWQGPTLPAPVKGYTAAFCASRWYGTFLAIACASGWEVPLIVWRYAARRGIIAPAFAPQVPHSQRQLAARIKWRFPRSRAFQGRAG